MKRIYHLLVLCLLTTAGFAQSVPTIYALSGSSLLSFKSNAPSVLLSNTTISGVKAGETLVGMDFRPATGELMALGYNSSNNEATLYKINLTTAFATAVNATPTTLMLGTGNVGFDFNPTVDRIRIESTNRKNYRLHPGTGAIAATDLDLAYAAGDPNAAAVPQVGSVAYTNSYIGSTSTALYVIDELNFAISLQNPPNNGTLNTVSTLALPLNLADKSIDFDIFFDPSNFMNYTALAANPVGSANDNLYILDLTTGQTTLLGAIGNGLQVSDIAVLIDRSLPALVGTTAYALTTTNNLISFDTKAPSFVRSLFPVTGLRTGEVVVGLDFRPATKELYALGYSSAKRTGHVYTINSASGVATAVDTTTRSLSLGNGNVGFDFNPTVDRIRVVAVNDSNFRLHPVTGAIAATDVSLAYNAGDVNFGMNPDVGTVAYTNSYSGSTATALYFIDETASAFGTIDPPNNGTLKTLLPNALTLNPSDLSIDADVYFDPQSMKNLVYLAFNKTGSTFDELVLLDVSTGTTSNLGRIGYGIAIKDIALPIDYSVSVGLKNIDSRNELLHLAPNPASTYTKMELSSELNGEVSVEVSDLSGKIIARYTKQAAASITIPTEELNAGIYFVKVNAANGLNAVTKLIKN